MNKLLKEEVIDKFEIYREFICHIPIEDFIFKLVTHYPDIVNAIVEMK